MHLNVPLAIAALALGSATVLFLSPGRCQSSAADEAFEAGMQELDAGHYAAACPLLQESLELDYGMATEFRLAECLESWGRTHSAYLRFLSVAQKATAIAQHDREGLANERAESLKPKLMRLLVKVPDDAAGSTVRIFDAEKELTNVDVTQEVALDPGTYRVIVETPGQPPFEESVSLSRPGETWVVQAAFAPPQDAPLAPVVVPVEPKEAPSGGPTAQTIVGLGVGGLGLVGLGVGTALGFAAKSEYDESQPFCSGNDCAQEGIALRDDGRSLGTTATIIFIAGGVLAAGGAVIWLTAPSSDPATELGLSPSGLALRHQF